MTINIPPRLGSICRTGSEWEGELLAVVREPKSKILFGVFNAKTPESVYSIGNFEILSGSIPDHAFMLAEIKKARDVTYLRDSIHLYFVTNGGNKSGFVYFRVFGVNKDLVMNEVTHEIAGLAYKTPLRYGIAGDNIEGCLKALVRFGFDIPVQVLVKNDFKPFFYHLQNSGLENQFLNLGGGYGGS